MGLIPMPLRPELGGTAFDPPHRELLTAVEMDDMIANRQTDEGVHGAVVHNAALAAFKLWDDSPQSRQYLELAARMNPLILFKILGRITVPSEYNKLRLHAKYSVPSYRTPKCSDTHHERR